MSLMESDHKGHGGSRRGGGRKKIRNKRIKRSFTLRPETSEALDVNIEASDRSYFVDESISKSLKELEETWKKS